MKRWMIAAAALLLTALLAGCAETRDGLRTGTTEGVTAQIVPADTGLPEPVALAGKKPMVKHFHQPKQLVKTERIAGREDQQVGQTCTMCGTGIIQYDSTIEGCWLTAQTIDCPIEGAGTQDLLMRRFDMVQYLCTNCRSGYTMGLTYEAVNCQSENDESSGT